MGSRDERGSTAVEYALLVGFCALVMAGGAFLFGSAVSDLFGRVIPPWPGG